MTEAHNKEPLFLCQQQFVTYMSKMMRITLRQGCIRNIFYLYNRMSFHTTILKVMSDIIIYKTTTWLFTKLEYLLIRNVDWHIHVVYIDIIYLVWEAFHILNDICNDDILMMMQWLTQYAFLKWQAWHLNILKPVKCHYIVFSSGTSHFLVDQSENEVSTVIFHVSFGILCL